MRRSAAAAAAAASATATASSPDQADGKEDNKLSKRPRTSLIATLRRRRCSCLLTNCSASTIAPHALIAVATALAYSPTLQNGYVWDDRIFRDARQVTTYGGLYDIWTKPGTIEREAHYWPMVYTSFWVDYHLFGNNPVASHVINVAIHAVNSCLILNVLKRIGLNDRAATLSAMIFALHPVHVESVAWAIERKDTLSTLLYLMALLWHPCLSNNKRPMGFWMLSLIFYALAVLTKSIAVSLPAVLLLIPWFMRGTIRRDEFLQSIPFFVVGASIAIYDIVQMGAKGKMNFGYSFVQRIMIASRAVCFYLWKIVMPTNLAMIYPLWILSEEKVTWYLSVIFVACSLIGLFLMRHRWGRGPISGLLFFGMTVGPTLGLIDYSYMLYSFVADRYQYLAMLGPTTVLSSTIVFACDKSEGGKPILPLERNSIDEKKSQKFVGITILLGISLYYSTFRECFAYRDNESFFGHSVRQNSDTAMNAWFHLAVHYADSSVKKPEKSVASYRRALQIINERRERVPTIIYDQVAPMMYNNAGNTLIHALQTPDAAIMLLKEAAEHLPKNAKVHQQLADALSKVDKNEEAIEYFTKATQLDPSSYVAWGNMGNSLARLFRKEEAEAALKKALAIKPDKINFRHSLATVYAMMGKHGNAIKEYDNILLFDPNNAMAKERKQTAIETIARHQAKLQAKQKPKIKQ